MAIGTQTVPRCDMVCGPGNKYVAAAKRRLYGNTGIDFIAGPSDILVITGRDSAAELAAADMLAQAEHDSDARARALVPDLETARQLEKYLTAGIKRFPAAKESLEHCLIIVYGSQNEAVKIANAIAPEHLELQVSNPGDFMPALKNYGSLFIGNLSAEVLGDYSSGLNHTLPTSGSARFTGGLSVRCFLKFVTTLRCEKGAGYAQTLRAAETIGMAEGLSAHAESAMADYRTGFGDQMRDTKMILSYRC
jgi:histidinol dehydrogenase